MPKIKIDKVISFSTEDPVHIAANILSTDPAKKWKCAQPGEKSCSIVLQLEKASMITSIDIGNEHSAYIEVLANRSGGDGDYKVLLVMSAFMSPLESRQSQNINKVRMFTQDQLSKPESEQKWDQIKIVCTQPFNKHVQYGLSFISLHSNDEKNVTSHPHHVSKFTLRPDSPDNLTIGSLFARRKELEMESTSKTPKNAAAAIRDASLNPCTPKNKKKIIIKKPESASKGAYSDETAETKNRNRSEIMYTEEDDDCNEKIDRLIELKRKQDEEAEAKTRKEQEELKKKKDAEKERKMEEAEIRRKNEEKAQREKEEAERKRREAKEKRNDKGGTPLKKTNEEAGSSLIKNQNDENSRKRKSEDFSQTAKKKPKITKPFSELLNGVTLVISGIQNPERGTIRNQALAMGARYKPDWEDRSCTHLICAFPNTPKFNQVKGKGKIVTKNWILDGFAQKKRLPWRRYALDPSDLKKDESEDEVEETIYESPPRTNAGSDTDDEIERIRLQQTRDNQNKNKERMKRLFDDEVIKESKTSSPEKINEDRNSSDDVEILSVDENKCVEIDSDDGDNKMEVDESIKEDDEKSEKKENYCKLPKLATFFESKSFYIDGNLDEAVRKRLNKYIIAYKGEILEDATEAENVISEEDCVEELKGNFAVKGTCLVPDWVWDCHNNKKLMPMEDFIL